MTYKIMPNSCLWMCDKTVNLQVTVILKLSYRKYHGSVFQKEAIQTNFYILFSIVVTIHLHKFFNWKKIFLGTSPQPGWIQYNTSKAALKMLAKIFALETAAHGARVNILSPGYIDTEIIIVPDKSTDE